MSVIGLLLICALAARMALLVANVTPVLKGAHLTILTISIKAIVELASLGQAMWWWSFPCWQVYLLCIQGSFAGKNATATAATATIATAATAALL